MAILYPTNLDEFTDPGAEEKQGLSDPKHSVHHKNHNDAIEALQAKVGADSSAVESSHDYKLGTVTGSNKAETQGNKRTSFQATPDDTAYASEKLVKDSLDAKLANVVEDTTPQLGGQLDVNGQALGDGTLELLKFSETASAVNEITVKNNSTGNAPELQATGDDTNIDLKLVGKGTGGYTGRRKLRVTSETSSATPTINTDNCDIHRITALAVDITSMTTNLSGTPNHGDKLIIEITGTAARAITWGASFEASTVALPTTTVTTAMLSVGFVYNSATSKWRCLASA